MASISEKRLPTPNGSGKTTAINCMLSLLKYDKGTIEIFGEPMSPDNPLRRIKDSDKLLITPHIGWASVEARTRLMQTILGYCSEAK